MGAGYFAGMLQHQPSPRSIHTRAMGFPSPAPTPEEHAHLQALADELYEVLTRSWNGQDKGPAAPSSGTGKP